MVLPDDVDKEHISAHVEHGVLTVELPKLKKRDGDKPLKAIEVK